MQRLAEHQFTHTHANLLNLAIDIKPPCGCDLLKLLLVNRGPVDGS